jgi:hypothetical protein
LSFTFSPCVLIHKYLIMTSNCARTNVQAYQEMGVFH